MAHLIIAVVFIIAACIIVPEAIPAAIIFLPAILLALVEDIATRRRTNANRETNAHKNNNA